MSTEETYWAELEGLDLDDLQDTYVSLNLFSDGLLVECKKRDELMGEMAEVMNFAIDKLGDMGCCATDDDAQFSLLCDTFDKYKKFKKNKVQV